MKLITWNVLHRIHAENWDEREVLERFPDERERIEAIGRRVGEWVAGSAPTCVCLQEVSGDLLAELRRRFPGAAVHNFPYPRVPRLKRGGSSPLADLTEHLAIIVPDAVRMAAAAFPNDPGKGFLAVRRDRLLLVNTHVSFGRQGDAQVARLATLAPAGPAVLCGDFNRSAGRALASLGEGFAEVASAAKPGRSSGPDAATPHGGIDHVFLRGLRGSRHSIGAPAPESDHQPVAALLEAEE